jgi:hypothetical protein
MHFKVIPTPKSRTLKQNAQEAQTLIKISVTTAITITAIIITITVAITAITIAVTTAIKATLKKAKKKVKKKAKGRVLPLKKWHKRLNHLNYANVK